MRSFDEPTNDLDESGLSHLTNFVIGHHGPVLLVSHDRRFLEATINVVIEFDPHLDRVTRFDGGYQAWQRERERAHATAVAANEEYEETVSDLVDEAAAIKRRSARGVRTAQRAYAEGSVDKLLRDRMVDGATAGAGSARDVKRQLEKWKSPKPFERWEPAVELSKIAAAVRELHTVGCPHGRWWILTWTGESVDQPWRTDPDSWAQWQW